MLSSVSLLLAIAALPLAFTQSTAPASNSCKCIPGDPCWPSDADFQTLNQTVAGKLIRALPPGSSCYKDQPNYNKTHCDYVLQNWQVSTFHAEDPVSVGWPQFAGNPCPPIYENGTSANGDTEAGAKGCRLGGYPVYSLNATTAEHVQAVVRFAKDYNIRLNVKSTGHSFQGRSTAFGSISIWTHWLQGIEYTPNFQSESCNASSSPMAFRIAAGSRVRDVYEAANKQNAVAVGGSAQDVGIVGWFTSGGHGPLTSTYGMGADNVLQANIVTPDGELVTANECQNSDLFWAIRGGGGSTFGVITEVVMKGYPAKPVQSEFFEITPMDKDNVADFWTAVTYFWSELPRLKEGGLSGYSFLLPALFNPDGKFLCTGTYSLTDQPNGTADALFEPIDKYMANLSSTVNYTRSYSYSPDFFTSWNQSIGYEAVGSGGGVLGSRLLDAKALTSDPDHLKSTLQNLTDLSKNPYTTGLQFFMVANSANRNLNVSLNPAWRDAVLHVIGVGFFLDNATIPEQHAVYNGVTNELVPQLKSLAPDSGAYINEGDPNDPNWQYTFYGENYQRLRAVKERYDPTALLWCRGCVGSEDWMPHSKLGDENGEGRLCRASWVVEQNQMTEQTPMKRGRWFG